MHYFHVEVVLKNNCAPLAGVREFHIADDKLVYQTVLQKLLKQYKPEEIIKLDVWLLAAWSNELKEYLKARSN